MTPRDINDLLNRRSDLSTFVVHLTKDCGGHSAHDNLLSILTRQTIEARSPVGWKGKRGDLASSQLEAMKVVCFSETPLEHVYTLFQEIAGRDVCLSTYGLAFTKDVARRNAINPVWYVDMSRDRYGDWEIAMALDELRAEAAVAAGGFGSHPASKILPFIEPMGTWGPFRRKEFSWEREWRRRGDLRFLPAEVALVFCSEGDIPEFEASSEYRAVDPSWSLERMVDHLRHAPRGSTSTGVALTAGDGQSAPPRGGPPIVVLGRPPGGGATHGD